MVRHLPAALALAAVLGAIAVGAAGTIRPPRLEFGGPVWRYHEGDLLYRFHATLEEEKLFDAEADPYETKDLSAARAADLERMRAAFLRRMHVPGLEKVPDNGEAWLEYVHGLGYR